MTLGHSTQWEALAIKVPLLTSGARNELSFHLYSNLQSQDPARLVFAEIYEQRLIGKFDYLFDQINEDRLQQFWLASRHRLVR